MKGLTINELIFMVKNAGGFQDEIVFDQSKLEATPQKLTVRCKPISRTELAGKDRFAAVWDLLVNQLHVDA